MIKQTNKLSRIPEFYNQQSFHDRWTSFPGRIFLDSNIVKSLFDFGEFIFDNYQENKNYFTTTKNRQIKNGSRLYKEIEALASIFSTIGRANFELTISQNTYKELLSSNTGGHLLNWINELNDYWRSIVRSHKKPFSKEASIRHQNAAQDLRIKYNFSAGDREILLDAIQLDCGALLTIDRFANEQNQKYLLEKYKIMVLWPTDFVRVLGPFQALYF